MHIHNFIFFMLEKIKLVSFIQGIMSTQDVTVLARVNKLHLKSENGNIKYNKIKCYILRISKREILA